MLRHLAMQPYVIVDRQTAADGALLELVRHGHHWIVRVAGRVLMSSQNHRSEDQLAQLAITDSAAVRRVLVGGLGLGFTLRAVLDRVSEQAEVTVAELVPAVVEWNRGPVAALAGEPLRDPRVSVHAGDVAAALSAPNRFDVVLLDVDNGPSPVAHQDNEALYGDAGSRKLHRALTAQGVLAVWSAEGDPRYQRTLERAGFRQVVTRSVRAHGARHFVFVAQK